MVLLTSSAVSAVITSVIVFMFTSALFLSGYVLQQQTVRDLRAAIRPRETPQAARLYLPPQFNVQPEPSPNANAIGKFGRAGEEIEVTTQRQDELGAEESSKNIDSGNAADVLDDRIEGGSTQGNYPPAQEDPTGSDVAQGQKPIVVADEPSAGLQSKPLENQPQEVPVSRAERRRKIKEEILAAGEGEGFKGYKRRKY